MANRFFYLWRRICLFSSATTLIFYSSFAYSAYSISHTFSLSDFQFDGSSFNSSAFITSTLVSETKDLLPTSGGLSGLSHEMNFNDHVCYEAFESLDYSFSNIKNGSITIQSCSFKASAPNKSLLQLSFSFSPKSGGSVSVFASISPNSYSSCAIPSASEIQEKAGTLDASGNPILIPNETYILLDYPNTTHNIDHACWLVLDSLASRAEVITDPPVDMSINTKGCFDISKVDLAGMLYPYTMISHLVGQIPSSLIKNMPVSLTCAVNESDRDSDGVPDVTDKCPVSGVLVNGSVGENGCPVYQDSDSDGIPEHDGEGNSPDKCPNSTSTDVNSNGCSNSSLPQSTYYLGLESDSVITPFTYTWAYKTPKNQHPIIDVPFSVNEFKFKGQFVDYLNSFGVFNFTPFRDPILLLIHPLSSFPHDPPIHSAFLSNQYPDGTIMFSNDSYTNNIARIPSLSFDSYFKNDYSLSKFSELMTDALGSGFQVDAFNTGSNVTFFDPATCRTQEFPTSTYSVNAAYGSTFYFSGFPSMTLDDYNKINKDYELSHSVLDSNGEPIGSIPLMNPTTKRPILTNSSCSSDIELMQCYYQNQSIISESGYVTCKDGDGNNDFSKIPKYVSSGVPSPLFSDMLANNQTLSDLENRSFGFGSTSPPCPVYNFDFTAVGLGVQSVNYHCQLINQFRLPLDAMFYGLWSFIAVRVFLSA